MWNNKIFRKKESRKERFLYLKKALLICHLTYPYEHQVLGNIAANSSIALILSRNNDTL